MRHVRTVPAIFFAALFFQGAAVQAEEKTTDKPDAKKPAANATSKATPKATPIPTLGIEFPVEKEVLPNGLTVIYHVDRSAPLISYHTWFRVGSKDERTGLTGIAHLFEHMMFKGSKKYSGDQFDLILQGNGAVNNAFTTQDYTGYHIDAPSSRLELIMDIESDRMATLKIDKNALDSEREVVKEERRFRLDDNPMGLLWNGVFSTVYKKHPYSWPVIGSMEDLGRVTPEIAQNFHRVFYSPTNAVVVIAGDFDVETAKALVRKYYGPIPKQEVKRVAHAPEPAQTTPRSNFIKRDVNGWTMAVNYPVPAAGTNESYALDLLAAIMGRGTSSRLHKRIVYKEQWATSVSASNNSMQDSGLFQIFVSLKPVADKTKAQKQFNDAQRAVYGELWRPRYVRVSDVDLERARNQTLKAAIDSLKTIHGRAEALVTNEILFGDYRRVFTDLDRYLKVTPAQIQKVANQYLAPEQSNLVVVRPKAD